MNVASEIIGKIIKNIAKQYAAQKLPNVNFAIRSCAWCISICNCARGKNTKLLLKTAKYISQKLPKNSFSFLTKSSKKSAIRVTPNHSNKKTSSGQQIYCYFLLPFKYLDFFQHSIKKISVKIWYNYYF